MTQRSSYISVASPNHNGGITSEIQELVLYRAAQYAYAAALVVTFWDWILTAHDEYRMVIKTKSAQGHFLDSIYLMARFSSMLLLVVSFWFTDSGTYCMDAFRAIDVAQLFVTITNSALFLFRAIAIYSQNKLMQLLFVTCWLVLLGCNVAYTVAFAQAAAFNPITGSCDLGIVQKVYAFASDLVFDIVVYLSVSWRITSLTLSGDTLNHRIRAFVSGEGLFNLSKSLLRGGQLYYFTTVGFKLGIGVAMNVKSVPLVLTSILIPLQVVIVSVTTYRVYRELKLGFNDRHETLHPSALVFAKFSEDLRHSVSTGYPYYTGHFGDKSQD